MARKHRKHRQGKKLFLSQDLLFYKFMVWWIRSFIVCIAVGQE